MIEEVVVEEKQSVPVKWEEKVKKTLKYKTSDGNLYDSKEKANSRQKYLDQKAKIVSLDIGDSLFGPDWGELWFFNTFEEMDLIVRNEYDANVSIGGHEKSWDKISGEDFISGWYFLQHNSCGDSRDYTTIWCPEEVKDSMKKTLEVFSYMSVIENH